MENDDVTVLLVWNGPGVGKKWQLDGVLRPLTRERGEESDEEAVVVKEKRIGKIKPEKMN
jgi:hypothetical protein